LRSEEREMIIEWRYRWGGKLRRQSDVRKYSRKEAGKVNMHLRSLALPTAACPGRPRGSQPGTGAERSVL